MQYDHVHFGQQYDHLTLGFMQAMTTLCTSSTILKGNASAHSTGINRYYTLLLLFNTPPHQLSLTPANAANHTLHIRYQSINSHGDDTLEGLGHLI